MTMRATIDFLLHEWLQIDTLFDRPRFADHSRETVGAVLESCERIARDKFAPINRRLDIEEPRLEGERVVLPGCLHEASEAYVRSGMFAAGQDYDIGGMQLPHVVEAAANCFFSKASIGASGGHLLTTGNASLILAHGTRKQQQVFAQTEFAGRWFGTMCLSEPQAGSSLSDIVTRAEPDGADFTDDPLGPRYRLRGNKMWISNGDHELTENIVHLVLAKIPGADGALLAGTRGISLFIVPKHLVDTDAQLTGERNDVVVAGLNHKLGWRGTPNTLLNFGEGRHPVRGKSGAIGYLVGNPGDGLRCMFHMMNEARIAVGIAATMIGYAGYEASLDYAKARQQGRPSGRGAKDASRPPVRIIEHADVKRMLLAQKSYVEGALALDLYCARCVDEQSTGSAESAEKAHLLLEMLTPIAKSWPSEWCLEANSLAIQIHGGYGYTRDFPVEQYWRDNRLNMIHEGTHGIQALDLLGRKVVMDGGRAMELLIGEIKGTVRQASSTQLSAQAQTVSAAADALHATVRSAFDGGASEAALANATSFLQAFGHVVIAWQWLSISLVALDQLARASGADSQSFLRGKLQAARYFHEFELPKVDAWLAVVANRNPTCLEMQEAWF